uniref:Uncharacterized protein n=1 Tax=Rhodopseudomonas palustris (strain BisA53) TaxID=316055 RepID=Q07Q16_RHOP5
MKAQRPIIADDDHRVIPFRPRGTPDRGTAGTRAPQPADDLEQGNESDDFRQRMVANIAAFTFTACLTAVGIWLAINIADLQKAQDCLLAGRRDCGHLFAPGG